MVLSVLGSVLEEAFRELVFPDFTDDDELFDACALRAAIEGAGPSTSQLHCLISAIIHTSDSLDLTLKNSPKVLLYGLQGFPLTYLRSFVNQNRRTSSILSSASSDCPIAINVFG